MRISEVNKIVSPLIRKYDWEASQKDDDTVVLTVTDGQESASVEITTGEDIESEAKRLIKAVDEHNYSVIG